MRQFWKDILYRNGYVLIAAAWLFTLSFIFSNYWSYTSSPQGVINSLEKFIQRNEKSFQSVIADTALMQRLVAGAQSETEVEELTSQPYGIFLYTADARDRYQLQFWNTQLTQPTAEILASTQSHYLINLPNGQYEVIRNLIFVNRRPVLAIYLLPVRSEYFLSSNYLQNGFTNHPQVEDNNYRIAEYATAYPVRSETGKTLFYLQPKSSNETGSNDWVTLLLRLLGLILILLFLHTLALAISKEVRPLAGLVFLVVVVVGLRALSYEYDIPVNFRQFELFDPQIYGSGVILRSLGDLLINSLLFFWLVLFARGQMDRRMGRIQVQQNGLRWFLIALLSASLLFVTIICGHIIRSLVADSQVSFDVTNFFSLNIYSVFGFIVLSCVCLGYFTLSQIMIRLLDQLARKVYYVKALTITIFGLVGLTLRISQPYAVFELCLLGWLLLYVFLMGRTEIRTRNLNFPVANALFWLFIFSASIATIIIFENRSKELQLRKGIAEKLVMQADPSSERLLNITIQVFTNKFFLDNLERLRDPVASKELRDSLISANFRAYLNKYDTELYFFDRNEQPLASGDSRTFSELNTLYNIQARNTTVPGLKYYETAFDKFSYIYLKEVRDPDDSLQVYFFMRSVPRQYRGEALYPELFKQPEDYSFEGSPYYAFAVYDRGELVSYTNDYSFPSVLSPGQQPQKEFEELSRNGYNELWYKGPGDKVIVVTRQSNFLLEAITLFAYLFCAFLFLVAMFQIASVIVRSGFRWGAFREIWQLNIRSQIYSTIIFISIFSFIVIGAATIIFFINRYNRNNRDKLSRTIQQMTAELKKQESNYQTGDNTLVLSDSTPNRNLNELISYLAEIHHVDINLYRPDGHLELSSQPFVYTKGVLSRMMEPRAYYHLTEQRKIQYVQEEQYGKLAYLSIYVPMRDSTGRSLAYLNIPYFASQSYLNQEISNFLVTIINLNAFIFLIAGVISLFLTNRITDSFSLIGAMMKEVNLGKHNAEIEWKRSDEIGELVTEYNKMVHKLDESAAMLAKTEREGAWREMARQVAHEIKNPLTPMKLSIQYLQKAIANNAPNVKELSSNVAKTLIEQIDHLSKIAADFSQFANIGNARHEVFNLQELLRSLISLHDAQERVAILWRQEDQQLMINADRTQINRLFTNLFQNAIEAIPDDKRGIIKVEEQRNGATVLISVSDNGAGIPEDTQSKIFTPNFTTKTSGTGLGLAMCKGIVEQAKGRIWFETEINVGTTFFVELPLARPVEKTEPQSAVLA